MAFDMHDTQMAVEMKETYRESYNTGLELSSDSDITLHTSNSKS